MPSTERRALSVVFTSMLRAVVGWTVVAPCVLGAVSCTRFPQCLLYADDGWVVISCGASFNALGSTGESELFCCLFKVLPTAVLLGYGPLLCRATE